MGIEKSFKKLWFRENIKHEGKRIKDLKKILQEMDKGKKVVLAMDVGGKLAGIGYVFPERQWVADDLRESQQNLSEYKGKLRKVL